jgi:hypothetical protein
LFSSRKSEPEIQIQKSVQALKLISKTQKFKGIDIFLSFFLLSQIRARNSNIQSVQSFEEAEIQDSKIQWKRKRKKVEIAITYIHRPS